MLQSSKTCKLQNSLFSYINSDKEASNANGSGTLNQYRELKSPINAKYQQIPNRARGFDSSNSEAGDGRSPQSKQGGRVNPVPAETIGRRIDSDFMKNNFDGSQPSKPIITQGCPNCGSEYGVITEGTPPHHTALRCGCCNRFLKWLPKPKGDAIRQNDSFAQLNNMGGR